MKDIISVFALSALFQALEGKWRSGEMLAALAW